MHWKGLLSGGEVMKPTYSYACRNYPGMEECPGRFYADSKNEIWKLIEVHATIAHGEDPATWTTQDRAYLETLIKREEYAQASN
jgi:hypothetical protein